MIILKQLNEYIMASATGIPQERPQTIEDQANEPLLGGPGASTQGDDDSIAYNVLTGGLSCQIYVKEVS